MAEKIKAFCCWSSGKESAFSFYRAKKAGLDIAYLVNMVTSNGKYSRTHGIAICYLRHQAEALGIPIIQRRTTWQNYESEFKKVVSGLKNKGVEIGVFGDIDLKEHRDWVERICQESGFKPMLPLWKEKREELLKDFIGAGFKAIVVATQAACLGKEWLGRQIDEKFIADIKNINNIDLCGEKGEYHTFVYDGPIFKEPIKFKTGKKILQNRNWFLELGSTA